MLLSKLKQKPAEEIIEAYRNGSIGELEYQLYALEKGWLKCPTMGKEFPALLRRRLGISQYELSLLLGVSLQTVTRWEMGRGAIPPLARLALSALDKSPGHLTCYLQMTPEHPDWEREQRILERAAQKQAQEEAAIVPVEVGAVDEMGQLLTRVAIINLRRRLGLSRIEFARFLHVSLSSIDKWENGTSRPLGITEIFLKILAREDKTSEQIIRILKKSMEPKPTPKPEAETDKETPTGGNGGFFQD